jgi:hypothetical protein
MNTSWYYNLVVLTIAMITYYLYEVHLASGIPVRWKGLSNAFVSPFLFGFVAYLVLRGYALIRLFLVSLIPIAVLLGILLTRDIGSDPAYPGIHWLIFVDTIVVFCIGALGAAGIVLLLARVKRRLADRTCE